MTGVESAFLTNSQEAESKGIKAHFRMDDSGILHLDKVCVTCIQSMASELDAIYVFAILGLIGHAAHSWWFTVRDLVT